MKKKKFTIIGGDLRNIKLAESIEKDGHLVNIYGFSKAGFDIHIGESADLRSAIDESDIVLGPLPCSNDDVHLNAPFHDTLIEINDVLKIMNKNQLFIAGRISDKIRNMAEIYNVYCVDLLKREDMAILNAIPTAEGAIQIAMEELPITIHGSSCMVLGFGRIGKILSKDLAGLGADVYAAARKSSDIALIRSFGYKPVAIQNLDDYLPKMDVIFNTVPALVLDSQRLAHVSADCLIIDLASKPGGVDFEDAKKQGKKVIWALSLPGKVAPLTAAKYIKETVYNVLEELGV